VLNQTIKEIDGVSYANVPYGFKSEPMTPGYLYSVGGIMEPVELLLTPALRLTDVFVKPDPATGEIRVSATVINGSNETRSGFVSLKVTAKGKKDPVAQSQVQNQYKPGATQIESSVTIANPQLW
jgi:beta-galactosidase/beta-glucuronidase